MPLRIVRNDITKMRADAIVNTANEMPIVGPGCDRAIYEAAGYEQLLRYRTTHIGYVPEGESFVTPAYNLDAKYIIHTVSPLFTGDDADELKLRSCYRTALSKAKELGASSIAFPLIATGSFRFPKEEGFQIATEEIQSFLMWNEMEVYLVVFDDAATRLGKAFTSELEEYINANYVEIKRVEEYQPVYPSASLDKFEEREERVASSKQAVEEYKPREERKIAAFFNRFGKLKVSEEAFEEQSDAYASAEMPDSLFMEAPSFDLSMGSMPAFEDGEYFGGEELEERMNHLTDTFTEYLLYLIEQKGLTHPDVYRRAAIDKKTFSKIKKNRFAKPKKSTIMRLCIGAQLNIDETKDLLARAGYALSPCDKTDIIFSFFIEHECYEMIELDIVLEEHGCPCFID